MLKTHGEGRLRMEGEGVTVVGEEMVQVSVEEEVTLTPLTSRLSNLLTSAQQAATASLTTSMSPSSSTTTASSSSAAMLSIQPSTSADQWTLNITEAYSAETVPTASSENSSLDPLFTTTLDTTTVSSTSYDTSGKQSTL
jgi:hypothetical protein